MLGYRGDDVHIKYEEQRIYCQGQDCDCTFLGSLGFFENVTGARTRGKTRIPRDRKRKKMLNGGGEWEDQE